MLEINKIYNEDCLIGLKKLDSDVVDLTVTSPPYDDLRKYNGYSFNFDAISYELFRVTKPGGVLVWVVGDKTKNGSETGTSFKQALQFMEVGFKLHDTMIFEKANPIPQNHNRYEQCFEYMFVFSNGKPNTFNPIKVPTKNAGKVFNWGDRKAVMDDNQCRRDRATDFYTVKSEKIHNNIFMYSVGGGKSGHPAVFPEQLARDHIISWSNPGDLVLDPFIGSGTTAKAAIELNRNYIGFEISKEYCDIAEGRLKGSEKV